MINVGDVQDKLTALELRAVPTMRIKGLQAGLITTTCSSQTSGAGNVMERPGCTSLLVTHLLE